jgi:hypothetical protein
MDSMPEVYIRSTDTSHPIGNSVQKYAERYYTSGFIDGVCLGVCVGITLAVLSIKR